MTTCNEDPDTYCTQVLHTENFCQNFPRNILNQILHGDGSFSRWFFTYHIHHAYLPCRVWWTSLRKEGHCDSVARTGRSCTGSVRTEYILVLSVLLVPSVLLVYLSLILRGIAVHISSMFNVALPRISYSLHIFM